MQYRSEPDAPFSKEEMESVLRVLLRHLDDVSDPYFTQKGVEFVLKTYVLTVAERELNRRGIYIERIEGNGPLIITARVDASKLAEPLMHEFTE
ncbi:MAG: sister chromatid cohesion protein PDS5 [Nitrosopumilus sp.]|nr:sister chromatid cohesion protein PDS5 [Nitrosopumilus sp.]